MILLRKKTYSISNVTQVSAVGIKESVPYPAYRKYFSIHREKAAAFGIAVFAHVLFAILLIWVASHSLVPSFRELPKIIEVTWIDLPRDFAHEQTKAYQKTPTAATDSGYKIDNIREKQISSNQPVIASPPEKITKAPASARVDHEGAVLETSAVMPTPAHAALNVTAKAAPQKTIETAGEDNLSSYTSVAKPRYRENNPPNYPSSERLNGHEGVVIISAVVLAEGRASNLQIKSSSGYRLLDQSALDAVGSWMFDPATKKGKAVSMCVDIPIRFVLKRND